MTVGILEIQENDGKPRTFPRREHLKRREDIQAVFKQGASTSCFGARLFFLHKKEAGKRIAFTFARKFGNSVERNRARRLGREAYRHLRTGIKNGYDFVLLVYPVKNNFQSNGLPDSGNGDNSLFPKDSGLSLRMRQMKVLLSKAGLFETKISS
jgi:ribonuclease P protein component